MDKYSHLRNNQADGFTLIEVLIASAIVTISMGVILQLFSSSILRILKTGDIAHDIVIEQQIIQELAIINPTNRTEGENVIAGKKIHWKVKVLNDLQVIPLTQQEDQIEKFVGLYEINANYDDANGNLHTLRWEQLGWK